MVLLAFSLFVVVVGARRAGPRMRTGSARLSFDFLSVRVFAMDRRAGSVDYWRHPGVGGEVAHGLECRPVTGLDHGVSP